MQNRVAPEAFAALLAEAVRAHGLADRVSVQSFDWRTLDAMAAIAPEIARVCLTAEGRFDTVEAGADGASPWLGGRDVDDVGGSTPRLVAEAGCATWSPHHGDLDGARLAEARALGLAVIPWTVNEIADMRRLLEAGVDGIITDYPNRLRALLVERGIGEFLRDVDVGALHAAGEHGGAGEGDGGIAGFAGGLEGAAVDAAQGVGRVEADEVDLGDGHHLPVGVGHGDGALLGDAHTVEAPDAVAVLLQQARLHRRARELADVAAEVDRHRLEVDVVDLHGRGRGGHGAGGGRGR